MSTETDIDLSREARRLIAHCSATGHFVADSRAAVICDVNIRNLVQTLAPAVEAGQLRRVRDASGVMGYRLPADEAAESSAESRNGTATAQTQAEQYRRSHGQEKSPTGPQNASAGTGLEARLVNGVPSHAPKRGKGGRYAALPDVDIAALTVRMAPRFDGRAHSQRSKWGALFDALASREIDGDLLPTIDLPPEYGDALGAAAAYWNKARKDGRRIRVARTSSATVVQLEA